MKLEVRDLSCGYGSRVVLAGLSMSVGEGEGMCLLGPNGVGKTTILRTILGLQPLLAGSVLLDGKDIRSWSPKQLAREVAYVPQVHHAPFPYCVLDVVTMGRTPHLLGYSSPAARDTIIAEEALDALGLTHLADQAYTEISGGERQMVLIARAVAQRARLLILDEPTSNLDLGNQVRVLKQIRKMIGEGIAVVVNSHVPGHAWLCATKVALFARGGGWRIGEVSDVLTEERLSEAYGVEVRIASIAGPKCAEILTCVPVVEPD